MLRRVTDLCFLKMPVNAVQYRVTVGIFNNRKLIINLRFELPSCSKLSNNLPNYDANYISLLFYIFLIAFLFSKSYVSKISIKLYISILLLFNILLGVLIWLCSYLIQSNLWIADTYGPGQNCPLFGGVRFSEVWSKNFLSFLPFSLLYRDM